MNQSKEHSKTDSSNATNSNAVKPKDNMAEDIASIRETITKIDNEFLSLLAKRRQCSESVAKQKQRIDKPLRDHLRERELIEKLVQKAAELDLDPHYVTSIFNTIIEDSVQFQQDYLRLGENKHLKTNNDTNSS